MDPYMFSVNDNSIASIAKISREFEEELESVFFVDNLSKKLVRNGVVNIAVDTKVQKDAFLIANFGVDTDFDEVLPVEYFLGMTLLDTLSKAKEELKISAPPLPTLQCCYKEFEKTRSSRRSRVKV